MIFSITNPPYPIPPQAPLGERPGRHAQVGVGRVDAVTTAAGTHAWEL